MININDIKNGMTVIIDGNIYLILEFLHVKPGKGPAFVRIKLKNLSAQYKEGLVSMVTHISPETSYSEAKKALRVAEKGV